jgi:hypothetical protein
LFYKAAKEVQQADIQQMAWWVPLARKAVCQVAYLISQHRALGALDDGTWAARDAACFIC